MNSNNINEMALLTVTSPQRSPETLPAAVTIWGDLSEYGIEQPCELQPPVVPSAPEEHENTADD